MARYCSRAIAGVCRFINYLVRQAALFGAAKPESANDLNFLSLDFGTAFPKA
jgi:hypothetical protein